MLYAKKNRARVDKPVPSLNGIASRALLFRSLSGTAASVHLDMVRGLSALAVLAFHLRGTFYAELDPGHSGMALSLFYFLTGLGIQAVMIFFVLSGFLVGGSVLRAHYDGCWNWRLYLLNRLSRLYVVLLPALILGAFWDRAGVALFGAAGIYGGSVANPSIATPVMADSNLATLAGNAIFLQSVFFRPFGSNGPLWSLSYEFWYYLWFPLLVMVLWPRQSPVKRIAGLAGALFLVRLLGKLIVRTFPIWLFGAALNFLPELQSVDSTIATAVALAVFWLGLACSSGKPGVLRYPYVYDWWVGGLAALLLYALLQDRKPGGKSLYVKIAKGLAGFSYTLYLVHLPALVFIKALIVPSSRWRMNGWSIMAGGAIALVLIAYSYAVARLTEYRTEAVRRFLKRLIAPDPERTAI